VADLELYQVAIEDIIEAKKMTMIDSHQLRPMPIMELPKGQLARLSPKKKLKKLNQFQLQCLGGDGSRSLFDQRGSHPEASAFARWSVRRHPNKQSVIKQY
jgi:hypothetical protein